MVWKVDWTMAKITKYRTAIARKTITEAIDERTGYTASSLSFFKISHEDFINAQDVENLLIFSITLIWNLKNYTVTNLIRIYYIEG